MTKAHSAVLERAVIRSPTTAQPLTDTEQKTLARIRHFIRHPPVGSRVFDLTPAICAVLLDEYNNIAGKPNRPRRPIKIGRFGEDMRESNWYVTGDTIKFTDAYRLGDGQNRLTACVRSDTGFTTHVVFGIVDVCFDRIDRNTPRTPSDVLSIDGHLNAVVLAGAVRVAHLITTGRTKARDTYEPHEIRELAKTKYQTLGRFVKPARAIWDVTRQPVSATAALLYLFNQKAPAAAADFAAAWAGGQWGGRFTPIRHMQAEVTRLHQNSQGRVHDTVRLAFIVIAWNLYISGKRGSKQSFDWSLADDFPTIQGKAS